MKNIYELSQQQFEAMIEDTFSKAGNLLKQKSAEYATKDKFHNFNVAGEMAGTSPEMALRGMLAKHIVSVWDLIDIHDQGFDISQDMWDEKCLDVINYMVLLRGLVSVRLNEKENGSKGL